MSNETIHTCPVCKTGIPESSFFCREHWFNLPYQWRNLIKKRKPESAGLVTVGKLLCLFLRTNKGKRKLLQLIGELHHSIKEEVTNAFLYHMKGKF